MADPLMDAGSAPAVAAALGVAGDAAWESMGAAEQAKVAREMGGKYLYRILGKLQTLPWRRVDVCFEGPEARSLGTVHGPRPHPVRLTRCRCHRPDPGPPEHPGDVLLAQHRGGTCGRAHSQDHVRPRGSRQHGVRRSMLEDQGNRASESYTVV